MFFFTKNIEIWQESGRKDLGAGVFTDGEYELTKELKADVQPYTRELARLEYGLDLDVTHVIFTPVIKVYPGKTIIKYRGDEFTVVKAIEWDDYCELLVDRRK